VCAVAVHDRQGSRTGQRTLCGEYLAGMESKNPKHQATGAASAVEKPVKLYPVSVEETLRGQAILIVISHPV
jgi:hypothetical protein